MPSPRPRLLAVALVGAAAITLTASAAASSGVRMLRIRSAAAGAGAAGVSWDATFFDANAARAGIDVGATPRAGAAMVWHSSDFPAWPGDVAYVNAVNPDGSLLITEAHAPTLWQIDQRVVPATEISGQDIDFIY